MQQLAKWQLTKIVLPFHLSYLYLCDTYNQSCTDRINVVSVIVIKVKNISLLI